MNTGHAHAAEVPAGRASRLATGLALLAGGLGCVISGCGRAHPETIPVDGRVTVEGAAVTEGQIAFYPLKGRMAYGSLQSDGTYRLTTFREGDGAVPGKHRVTITASRTIGGPRFQSWEEELTGTPTGSFDQAHTEWLVPELYARLETTPLTAEVVPGGTITLNFDLPAPP